MLRVPEAVGWLLFAACGYAALCLFAGRAAFYPQKFPDGLWSVRDELGAADVWLHAKDGVRLHAWWIRPPGARVATAFFHGNAGNVSHRVDHLREIAAAGSAVLALEYRGYGKSEGWPTERGLYADADAAYEYLLGAGYPPERIIVHGESLGAAVAVDVAARRPCGGVVLEAPFTSARDVARRVLPLIGPLITFGWDSKRKITAVRAPVFILHGGRDEVIPFELGRALFEAAHEPKQFWRVEGADHNNLVSTAGAAYREQLRAFHAGL